MKCIGKGSVRTTAHPSTTNRLSFDPQNKFISLSLAAAGCSMALSVTDRPTSKADSGSTLCTDTGVPTTLSLVLGLNFAPSPRQSRSCKSHVDVGFCSRVLSSVVHTTAVCRMQSETLSPGHATISTADALAMSPGCLSDVSRTGSSWTRESSSGKCSLEMITEPGNGHNLSVHRKEENRSIRRRVPCVSAAIKIDGDLLLDDNVCRLRSDVLKNTG